MADPFIDFLWQVCPDGYEWRIGRYAHRHVMRSGVMLSRGFRSGDGRLDGLMPVLTNVGASALSFAEVEDQLPGATGISNPVTYRPFADAPALFREFASLPLNPSCIARFADRRGSLGGDFYANFERVADDGSQTEPPGWFWGEPLGFWYDAISEMNLAVSIWQAVSRDDKATFAKHLSWGDSVQWKIDPGLEYDLHARSGPDSPVDDATLIAAYREQLREPSDNAPERTFTGWLLISSEKHYPERLEQLRQSRNGRQAAMYAVQDMINEGLNGRAYPRLEPAGEPMMQRIRLTPTGLLGALWLQFAFAVDGNIDYRQCSECQSWFEIAPGRGRPEKSYCSDACRMRAYRKRKAEK